MATHNLKGLPVVTTVTDSTVLFGSDTGQSAPVPDPISATAARDYVLTSMGWVDASQFDSVQEAIDHSIDNDISPVRLHGLTSLTTTLHIGYGTPLNNGYASIHLLGQIGYSFTDNAPTTRIGCNFTDSPMVNIQTGRNSGIDGIKLLGPLVVAAGHQNEDMEVRSDPASYTTALAQDSTKWERATRVFAATNWANSTAYVVGDIRNDTADSSKWRCIVAHTSAAASTTFAEDRAVYAPFCGVAIDGYTTNDVPVPQYHEIDYPAFVTGPPDSYDQQKGWSSACFITNCNISYCHIGVAQQPANESNGDFTRLTNTYFVGLKICYLVCNSQARSCNLDHVRASNFHTFCQATGYGHGIGNVSGSWSNLHFDDYYQIFDLPDGWSSPFTVTSLYTEVGMRIGRLGGNVIKFTGCTFHCTDSRTDSGQSSGVIQSERYEPVAESAGLASFDHCTFLYRSFLYHFTGSPEIVNCNFSLSFNTPAPTGTLLEAACGVLGSIAISIEKVTERMVGHRLRNNVSRTYYGGVLNTWVIDYDNDLTNCIWAIGQNIGQLLLYDIPKFECCYYETPLDPKSVGTQDDPDGNTRTMDFDAPYLEAGDVFYEHNRTWWYIESLSGAGPYTVVTRALSDYWSDDGVNYSLTEAVTPTQNMIYIPRGMRDFIPSASRYFRTTSGSPTLEVLDASLAAVNMTSEVGAGLITVKSKPLWYAKPAGLTQKRIPFPAKTYISSISAAAGTFTMTANALHSALWAYGPGIAKIKDL